MRKTKNKYDNFFEKYNEKDLIHLFIFNSSVQALISKLIIINFDIKEKNIFVVSQRDTDLSLFKSVNQLKFNYSKYDTYVDKIFFHNVFAKKIFKSINKYNKKFILYTPMASKETNWLLKKQQCIGHIYLENGQHSWMNILPFSYKKTSFFKKYKLNLSNKMIEGFRYRDDSIAYIGIHNDSFPDISSNKKIIFSNYHILKKYYSPKLKGDKIIGLTCAYRRLKNGEIEVMLKKLLKKLPPGSIIKPHPSFTSNKFVYNNFKSILGKVSQGKYKLCPSFVILELEMLFERKTLIGPKTSLSKYAIMMNSDFKHINLY